MSSTTKTKIIETTINLGKLPYFEVNNEEKYVEEQHGEHTLRVLAYHTNHLVKKFPLISHSERIKECMEFNLYLIERPYHLFHT